MSTAKEKYVLKEGVGTHTHHNGPGDMRLIKSGEIVELTEGQAKAFGDKFKPYSQVLAESEVAKRTTEIADALEKSSKKKAGAEQARLREEAETDLAEQRAKLDKESDEDEDEDSDEEDTDGNEDKALDDSSSSAKDADLKAQPGKMVIKNPLKKGK